MSKMRWLLFVPWVLWAATMCRAQSVVIDLPRQSQGAEVTQRIGLTDIAIRYHRPVVGGRTVWGKLVPYGDVWRAGANENTTISFSDAVAIEGQPLAAGTYGLHMIPGKEEWTVIFSKAANSWGSFSYRQEEDALRVNVKPEASEFHEALTYDFDQLKDDSTVVTLRWEKLAAPFKVSINLPETVAANFHRQFRGLRQYTWESWNDAADYLATHKVDLDEALQYADKSIQLDQRYDNLMTKSEALEAMGRKEEGAKFRSAALEKANAVQLYGYARQLQRGGQQQEAMAVFRTQTKKYPNEWISHMAASRLHASEGNFDSALKEMKTALDGAPDSSKVFVQGLIKRLEAKEDINKS